MGQWWPGGGFWQVPSTKQLSSMQAW